MLLFAFAICVIGALLNSKESKRVVSVLDDSSPTSTGAYCIAGFTNLTCYPSRRLGIQHNLPTLNQPPLRYICSSAGQLHQCRNLDEVASNERLTEHPAPGTHIILVLDPNFYLCWEMVPIDTFTNTTLLAWAYELRDPLTAYPHLPEGKCLEVTSHCAVAYG